MWACHFCSQWAGRNHANEKLSVCPVPLPCCIFFAHFFFAFCEQWDFFGRCEIFEAKLSDWQVCVRWWYRQSLAHCSWNVWTGPREVPYGHRYLRGLREVVKIDVWSWYPGGLFFWGGNLWWTWCEHLKTMARCLKDTTSVPWMHFDAFWIILAPLSAGPAMHFADVRRGKNASNYHFKLHRFECAGHLYHYGFLDAGSNPNPRQCVLPMHHRRTLASRLWCFVVLAVTVEMMSTEEEFSKMMPFQILLTFLNYHGTAQSIHSDTRSRMVQKGTLP